MARRRDVETTGGPRSYMAAARRFIAAAGRRAGDGDEPELAELLALRADVDAAVADAVYLQRARGASWARIALATGTTRQAAAQRWGDYCSDRAAFDRYAEAVEANRAAHDRGEHLDGCGCDE